MKTLLRIIIVMTLGLHASVQAFKSYFTAQSGQDVDGTMALFPRNMLT